MPADDAGQRFWFHILAQTDDPSRYHYAARLVEKAWTEGDRVCLACEDETQAGTVDEILWSFRPDAFLPHQVWTTNAQRCPSPIGVLTCDPSPDDWQSVIILGRKLPAEADRFQRLALVAHNDPQTLADARRLFRQLQALDIQPRVHDRRR